jgi:hypothetical protein
MEFFKKIPDICRQHWEKLLLTLVLIGLAGAAYYLYDQSRQEKQKIEDYFSQKVRQKTKMVGVVDLANYESAMNVLEHPPALNFSTPHNLFNPVKWQRQPDGSFLKIQTGKEIGPDALKVAAIRPLHLSLAVDRTAGSGVFMVFTNQAFPAAYPVLYRKMFFMKEGLTNSMPLSLTNLLTFVLKDAKPPEDPKEWLVEFSDSGERAVITKEKPYSRVEDYEADLRYDVENKTFSKVRVGGKIRLSGEDYNIVAINPNEVLLSADSNDRRYSIKFTGGP